MHFCAKNATRRLHFREDAHDVPFNDGSSDRPRPVRAGAAPAQDYPAKPVVIITGFAAGGIGDLGARLLADYITQTTGQQAVVENRTGAAGTLGTDAVAKAAPDGYTLGLVLNGNLVINPFVQKRCRSTR